MRRTPSIGEVMRLLEVDVGSVDYREAALLVSRMSVEARIELERARLLEVALDRRHKKSVDALSRLLAMDMAEVTLEARVRPGGARVLGDAEALRLVGEGGEDMEKSAI